MELNFFSTRLSETLDRVREQHPIRNGKDLTIGRSIVDEVRSLIEGWADNDISELAFRFDAKKLLACIEIVVLDKGKPIAKKAAQIARLRSRNSLILKGWYKLVRFYPNFLLEQLLKEMIEIKSFDAIAKVPSISSKVPMWFFSSDIATGILKDYQAGSDTYPFDVYLENNHIKKGDGLHKAAWQGLLTRGKPESLKRETSQRILSQWQETIEAEICIKMGQHYLNSFKHIEAWSEGILEHIYKTWRAPVGIDDNIATDNRFWQGVDPIARSEFRRWLILREVELFFEGERADFWRPYVESAKVKDVQQIISGNGFMLDFGEFGVVEFKNKGNAAYVYPKHIFVEFWGRGKFGANSPEHFKDISRTIKGTFQSPWDGRILHFEKWQAKTRARIKNLLR